MDEYHDFRDMIQGLELYWPLYRVLSVQPKKKKEKKRAKKKEGQWAWKENSLRHLTQNLKDEKNWI